MVLDTRNNHKEQIQVECPLNATIKIMLGQVKAR